nr:CopD family protein [Microvirga zambiensis]
MYRLLRQVGLAIFGLLLFTAAASAHAQLVRSDPVDGAVVGSAPGIITLTFSEPVRPLVARLALPNGQIVVLKEIGAKGSVIALSLPDIHASGTYVLSWRVASGDGHPIGGGLVFSVGAPSAAAPMNDGQFEPLVRAGLWSTRLLLMLALIVGVGGAGFYALIGRENPEGGNVEIPTAIAVGLLMVPLLIGFQGLDSLGAPLSDLLTAPVWAAGIRATSYGSSILIAASALIVAYASRLLKYTSRSGMALATTALLLAGLASASAGHASTAPPRSLTAPAVFLHTVAVLLWIGSLLPLVVAFTRNRTTAPKVLRRFSSSIPAIIGVLGLSGILLAFVQIRMLPALWSTDYGIVLLVKLALVASICVFAVLNRYWLTGAVIADDRRATQSLIRNTRAEIVLGTLVIAVLGLWRFTPPPRAMSLTHAADGQQIKASRDGASATLTIRPPLTGPVRVEVGDIQIDGKPVEPISVKIELDKPSYGIGPFVREARQEDQIYLGDGFVLPLDGFWIVRVTVLVTEFRSVTLTDVFDISKETR